MTKTQATLKEAIETCNMRIAGEGTMTKTGHKFFLVTSREYAKTNRMYIVEQHPGHLTCSCPATKPCVHIALVAQTLTQALKDERAALASIEQADLHAECGDWCPIVRQQQAEAAQPSTCAAVEDMMSQHNEQARTEAAQPADQEPHAATCDASGCEGEATIQAYDNHWYCAAHYQQVTWPDEHRANTDEQEKHAKVFNYLIEREPALAELFGVAEHADAMALLDRESTDDEWEEEQDDVVASRIADMERSLAWDREPAAQEPRRECETMGCHQPGTNWYDGLGWCDVHDPMLSRRQQRERSRQRETALLLTDDRAFSIFK